MTFSYGSPESIEFSANFEAAFASSHRAAQVQAQAWDSSARILSLETQIKKQDDEIRILTDSLTSVQKHVSVVVDALETMQKVLKQVLDTIDPNVPMLDLDDDEFIYIAQHPEHLAGKPWLSNQPTVP